jgi:secreted trypsin-like serine protease
MVENAPTYDIAIWKVEPVTTHERARDDIYRSIETVKYATDVLEGYQKNDSLRVVGWGYTSSPRGEETPKLSSIKNYVDVPVIENPECIQMYTYGYERYCREGRPSTDPRRHCYAKAVIEAAMCAGFEEGKKDACGGDSGGPLMYGQEDDLTVVGIVSWGDGCAQRKRPGVYSRVSYFAKWIHELVKKHAVKL